MWKAGKAAQMWIWIKKCSGGIEGDATLNFLCSPHSKAAFREMLCFTGVPLVPIQTCLLLLLLKANSSEIQRSKLGQMHPAAVTKEPVPALPSSSVLACSALLWFFFCRQGHCRDLQKEQSAHSPSSPSSSSPLSSEDLKVMMELKVFPMRMRLIFEAGRQHEGNVNPTVCAVPVLWQENPA